ncbi:MAG: CBS domain-containing protein [Actinomycetota bacterium]|nr:CBS domain-containing protein [Actinomycetota bacterium]
MSPRAAWRLEGLGFERVYDYVPGKADWAASGLPNEGTLAGAPYAGDAARRGVPTCASEEKAKEAWERARRAGWDRRVVVNGERVVLGLLREKDLVSDPEASVEGVMRNGPATFRPNEPVGKLAKRMRERGASAVVVMPPDGKLVGLLYREDAERLADGHA